MPSRWKLYPWSTNAKAICERVEDLIVELRLSRLHDTKNDIDREVASTKAILGAIEKLAEQSKKENHQALRETE